MDTKGFANDLATFRDRDDVLTLLIHLGYLAYNEITQKAHIPNEEIRLEFAGAIRQVKRDDTIKRAYFSYGDEYVMFEELPAGVGYADIVYLPKKNSVLPALFFWWGSVMTGKLRQGKESICAG